MNVNFDRTASDYASYRAGLPDELFCRLQALSVGLPGQRVLDLGTGTGAFARGFALRGCTVTGLDMAEGLVEHAAQMDAEAGVSIEYVVAPAEATGLPDDTFDVVGAATAWHWFKKGDVEREIRRLLKPDGRLALVWFSWMPQPGNVVEATERLIVAHNPQWLLGGTLGIYPAVTRDLANAGFTDIETFSFDTYVPYSHEAWRGRVRASAGVGASLPTDGVARFDGDLRELLQRDFPEDPLRVLHRTFAVICGAA